VAPLLEETLDEEKNADKTLTGASKQISVPQPNTGLSAHRLVILLKFQRSFFTCHLKIASGDEI
jgi:hypothetical protein